MYMSQEPHNWRTRGTRSYGNEFTSRRIPLCCSSLLRPENDSKIRGSRSLFKLSTSSTGIQSKQEAQTDTVTGITWKSQTDITTRHWAEVLICVVIISPSSYRQQLVPEHSPLRLYMACLDLGANIAVGVGFYCFYVFSYGVKIIVPLQDVKLHRLVSLFRFAVRAMLICIDAGTGEWVLKLDDA